MDSLLLVRIKNPWTGEIIDKDVSGTTEDDLNNYSALMDKQLCEDLHKRLPNCTPGEFLAAWAKLVGPDQAGKVMWG